MPLLPTGQLVVPLYHRLGASGRSEGVEDRLDAHTWLGLELGLGLGLGLGSGVGLGLGLGSVTMPV